MFTFEGEFKKMDHGDGFYIYGPASAEILDTQGDIIKIDAIRKALPQLLRRARVTVDHTDHIVGEILPELLLKGENYATEVRLPTSEEIKKYSKLEAGKEALFILAEIWDDTEYCAKIRGAIQKGRYKKYSITGNVLEARACTREELCGRLISKLNLSAVTICNAGANPAAEFDILKGDNMTDEKTIEMEKVEEKVEAPVFLKKEDFEKYVAETRSELKELTELIKKRFEEPKKELEIEKPIETAPEIEKEDPGLKIDLTKIKEEIKAELKEEYAPVQKSQNVEKKELLHEDIMDLFRDE